MILADVDLRLLRIFRTIVECEGLAPAEAKLNIGRSTISAHLSELENRLGVTLCKRGRGGFALTDAGQSTYAAALELFTHCETFVANVSDARIGLRGRLTIAVFDGCLNDHNCKLHRAIADIKATSDAVQFEVIVAPPDEVEIAVLNGRAMVGISTKRTPSEALEFIHLYDEVSQLYCSPIHPLAIASPKESKKLLSGVDFVNRAYVRGASPFVGLSPTRATALAHSEEAVAHLILSGQFIGFLPEHFAETYIAEGRMKRVAASGMSYTTSVGLVRKAAEAQNPLVSAFEEKLVALAK